MSATAGSGQVASERVAEAIAQRILAGELPPGTRIKQEELAAALDASRVPVRDALRILQARGLVTLRANTGAWVATMDRHDLTVSYLIRERVEPLLLLDSLPHLRDEEFAGLHEIQDRIEASTEVEEFLVLDRELHWMTYRAHQAPEPARIVAQLWDTTQHYRREFTRLAGPDRRWIINAEHRLLIDALESRDAEAAHDILTLHIRRTRVELGRHPQLFAGADGFSEAPAKM